MSQDLNINEIINLVKEANKNSETKIFIPSLNEEIGVMPMTASHLQQIITTTVSGLFANNRFHELFYSILKEIFSDKADLVPSLTTLDKIAILYQVRKINVRPFIEIPDSDGENPTTVQLDQLIEKVKNTNFNFSDVTVSSDNFHLTLNFPTLERESKFNQNFYNQYYKTYVSATEENNAEIMKKILGPLMMHEMGQYIKELSLDDNKIDFYTLDVKNSIAILSSVPGQVVTKLIDAIDQNFGKQLTNILTVEIHNKEGTIKKKIEINSSILT